MDPQPRSSFDGPGFPHAGGEVGVRRPEDNSRGPRRTALGPSGERSFDSFENAARGRSVEPPIREENPTSLSRAASASPSAPAKIRVAAGGSGRRDAFA